MLKAIKIDSFYLDAYINLSLVYEKLNEPLRAINSINMAIEIYPNYANPHYMKGRLCFESKEFFDSLTHFYKALQQDHDLQELNALIQTIKLTSLTNLNINDIANFKKYYLFLFKNLIISHSEISYNAILFLLETDNYTQIKTIFNSNSSLLNNKIIKEFVKDELLCLILQKSLLEGHFLEKVFTKLRFEMLTLLENSNKDFLNEYFEKYNFLS